MGYGSRFLFHGRDWDLGYGRKVDIGRPSIGLLAQYEELATRLDTTEIELLLGPSARVMENTLARRPGVALVSMGETLVE